MTSEPQRTIARTADVDVVVCCYTLKRWADITAGVQALGRQTVPPQRVLVVVDHNVELLERARTELPMMVDRPVVVIENSHRQGLSGARNTAIAASSARLLAFLDDDARPDARWLELLLEPFVDDDVWVTGGHAVPRWPSVRPRWFPPEFDWVIGCSYRGMPTTTADVRNVHGATMVFRRDVFARVGGFLEDVGRIGTLPMGCEETELCIRLRRDVPSARVVYVPQSRVSHRVSNDRVRVRYFLSRCRAEGLSKAAIAREVGRDAATADERNYMSRTLLPAFALGVTGLVRGDVGAVSRAGMIATGLAFTLFGYAVGTVGSLVRSLR